MIRRTDHFQVVFNYQNRVPQVAQLAQHVYQSPCIPLVQADGGFVSTYMMPVRSEPRSAASSSRWASPSDRVGEERSIVK